jgi:hypothetical protein
VVGIDNSAGSRLAQRQGLLQGREQQFGKHVLVEVPADYSPRVRTAPGRHVTPASADQGQVGNVPDPRLLRGCGRGLAQEQVFGHNRLGVGYGSTWALRPRAQRPQAAAPQPSAQRITPNSGALGVQFGLQASGAVALGVVRESSASCEFSTGRWARCPTPPLVIACGADL